MLTPEIREELRRIQAELKKPFPAPIHEVIDEQRDRLRLERIVERSPFVSQH
ncbi:MAG: hypothetical protein SAK29_40950 [Scytonema sp. PMC 1069.18]|nr:hypothetical protein [Scytonema sp. PMC 1069.18]MEC4884814.1 hypothetical protein [Scytonema sp. PMC 1070.18]